MYHLFLLHEVLLLGFNLSVDFVVFIIKLSYFILSLCHHLLLLMRGNSGALILLHPYLLLLYLVHACFAAVGAQVFDEVLKVMDCLRVVAMLRLVQVLGLEEALGIVLLIHLHQPSWFFLPLDIILRGYSFQIL